MTVQKRLKALVASRIASGTVDYAALMREEGILNPDNTLHPNYGGVKK